MEIIGLLEVACWVVFVVVWFISSFQAKRNLRSTHWWQGYWVRIVVLVLVYALFRAQISHWVSIYHFHFIHTSSPLIALIGLILTALGIAFAIWARFNIGTNWGMPMSLKENRELVTSGPYKYVRHPIYSGMLLAMLGAALVVGTWWALIFVIVSLYFFFSARSEEKTLTKEFPNEYPAYMKRTKMLIPFIL